MSAALPISIAYQPGQTVVAIIKNPATGFFWNTVTLAWEFYAAGHAAQYQVSLSDPNGIGDYSAAFPTQLSGLIVNVLIYNAADLTQPIGQAELSPPDTAISAVTPTSPDVVAVVNKALLFLGVGTIASLDEDSEAANRAKQIFAQTRTSLLRSHFWKFATYVETLALLADQTTPGWEYLYAYPAKCLMVRKIFDNQFQDPSLFAVGFVNYTYDYDFAQFYDLYRDILYRFKIVVSPVSLSKAIAAHVANAYIEYTYDVTNPEMWDQYFYDSMAWSLAAQLAHTLTGKTELSEKALQQLMATLSEAKRLDAQEDRQPTDRMSSYQRARM